MKSAKRHQMDNISAKYILDGNHMSVSRGLEDVDVAWLLGGVGGGVGRLLSSVPPTPVTPLTPSSFSSSSSNTSCLGDTPLPESHSDDISLQNKIAF